MPPTDDGAEPSGPGGQSGQLQLDVTTCVASQADVDRYRWIGSLIAAVASGDTALLKGSWLVQHCASAEGPLPARQDCPPEAFWQAGDLQRVVNISRTMQDPIAVPVVALSYCWETAEHPDPSGEQLRRVACAAKLCLQECADLAVFVDWCSLWQEPRTEEQQASFGRALDSVDLWYAHQMTWVWLLTSTPSGTIQPTYHERGWPYFERLVGGLHSHYDMLLDIGRPLESCSDYSDIRESCIASRCVPLTPDAFRTELASKVFARSEECEFLAERYVHTFAVTIGPAESLCYANTGLSAAEAKLLADALGWCTRLLVLSLDGNDLGPEGALAIAAALPGLPQLQGLYANRCGLQRGGAAAIIDGVKETRRIGGMYLSSNDISEDDAAALEDVFLHRHPRSVIHVS